MTITRTAAAAAIVGIVLGTMLTGAAADQDALARAKALYTSAAYDEALALLDQFDRDSTIDPIEVKQYRAFCLLALGRGDDARKVIQQIVEANPAYQPSDTQMSPRLQEAFREVRRRVLPSIVRQSYAEAKGAFERKELDVAKRRFTSVVALLDDADAKGSGELADLRILSNGFLDLIKTTVAVPEPVPATPAPQPDGAAGPIVAAPMAPGIFDAGDTDVTPPIAISQVVPPWHPDRRDAQTYDGTLILVIDEQGDVKSISVQGNIHPAYLVQLRRAATRWKYQPATKAGVPVSYRRLVAIHLNPTGTGREEPE